MKKNPAARQSARIAQIVGAALVVGGFLAIAFIRALGENGDPAAAWRTVGTIAVVSVPVLLVVLAFGVILTGGLVRPHNLRKAQGFELVKVSYTTDSSRLILSQFVDPTTEVPERRQPPRWMSVTIGDDGIGFWSGSSDPEQVLSIPWNRISRPEAVDVIERGRWCRGISLDALTVDGRLYKLELPLLGRGVFGLFSASESDIDHVVLAVRAHLQGASA